MAHQRPLRQDFGFRERHGVSDVSRAYSRGGGGSCSSEAIELELLSLSLTGTLGRIWWGGGVVRSLLPIDPAPIVDSEQRVDQWTPTDTEGPCTARPGENLGLSKELKLGAGSTTKLLRQQLWMRRASHQHRPGSYSAASSEQTATGSPLNARQGRATIFLLWILILGWSKDLWLAHQH